MCPLRILFYNTKFDRKKVINNFAPNFLSNLKKDFNGDQNISDKKYAYLQ